MTKITDNSKVLLQKIKIIAEYSGARKLTSID